MKPWPKVRPREDPRREELIARRPATADDVAEWARGVHDAHPGPYGPRGLGAGPKSKPSTKSTASTASTASTKSTYPEIVANGALALIAVACTLLSRQLAAQAAAFEQEGGFTERLYRVRSQQRAGHGGPR